MTSEEGCWGKALNEDYCRDGNIFHFYVRENGEMFFGVNGNQQGVLLSGINTRLPMYVVVDIYGNTLEIELLGETFLLFRWVKFYSSLTF
jgi:protein neuralized